MKTRRLTRQMREALASGEAEAILAAAARVLEARAKYGLALSTPNAVREYLRVAIGALEHEVFACVWLDAQNRVIEFEVLFRGTLTQTSVYPREVVKAALRHNAAGVVLSHSHPSGIAHPSQADELLTRQLRDVLMLVDVKVLDHLIVAGTHSWSFAEHGLL